MTELFGNRILLFVTGHETTTNLIGDGVATYLISLGREVVGAHGHLKHIAGHLVRLAGIEGRGQSKSSPHVGSRSALTGVP